ESPFLTRYLGNRNVRGDKPADIIRALPSNSAKLFLGKNFTIASAQTLPLHDRRERLGIETGAAHQRAVDLSLRHQVLGVLGLDAAAIENAHLRRHLDAESLGGLSADDTVRVCSKFRRGRLAGADGPDGLVGHYQRMCLRS